MRQPLSSFFIIIGLLALVCSPSYAFLDAITSTINAAEERAHRYFVEAKWVQNIQILTQNYQQSKYYYDYMKSISSHQGGVAGYVKDRVVDDIDRANNNLYWQMNNFFFTDDPANTAYVRKWVSDKDKAISNKLDYSRQIHDIGMQRDVQIKELAVQSANTNPSAQDVNRYNRSTSLMTVEILNELNKNIAQILKSQAEAEAREWEELRTRMIAQEKSNTYFQDMVKDFSKKSSSKNPYDVIKEIPK